MTVDLSTAKAGQIAHFRCGGSAKILEVENLVIMFENYGAGEWWSFSFLRSEKSPWAIIRLEDPPFGWKDVRPGMAFSSGNKEITGHFIGFSKNGEAVLELVNPDKLTYASWYTTNLTRMPEHDFEARKP